MSRHRNVRNMIAEEDDYYDDDYDDAYDDYDDDNYRAPVVTASSKKKKNKKKAAVAATNSSKPAAVVSAPLSGGGGLTMAPAGAAVATTTTTTTTTKATAAPTTSPLTSTRSEAAPVLSRNPSLPANNNSLTTTTTTTTTNNNSTPPLPPLLLEKVATKPTLTLVILGHVDAGKSTLTGQLLWQTLHNQSTSSSSVNNNRRSTPPSNMAWLLDEDEQERAHGVTMQVATKVLPTTRYHVVLQDAPGHKDYVPSMITGTAGANAALVVVDVTDFATSFNDGQLREHLFLAKGLGIHQLIIGMNKMDLLQWDQGEYESKKAKLQAFLQGQLGYADDKVHFLPLSGLSGINVVQKPVDVPQLTSWYNGPTLTQMLDNLDPPTLGRKLLEKPLRLLVTDVMGEVGNKGVSVRCKVAAGWMQGPGQALVLSPVQDETSILKMTRIQQVEGIVEAAEDHDNAANNNNERDKYAVAGDLLDLTLAGLDLARISTGNILSRPGALPQLTTRCVAKIFVLEGLAVPIIRGAQAILHMHYLDVPCHLSALIRTWKANGTSIDKERPRVLTSKVQALVEITLHYPIAMEAYADCRALGRFVLRRSGASIAVGRVEEVLSANE